jgi:hypothetical protein
MAANPNPPPLATAPGNGAGYAPASTVEQPAEGAPKRRTRRQAAPSATAPAPAPTPYVPVAGAATAPLSDDELQDLGALQVLSARAGVSVDDYVEDARRLCRSYDRFQAYVAARKAG